jgi:hypothetical protein
MSGEGRCIHVAFCALEANFVELRNTEIQLLRIPLLGTSANMGMKKGRGLEEL